MTGLTDLSVAQLREAAVGMPYRGQARRHELIEWLREYRPEALGSTREAVRYATVLPDKAKGRWCAGHRTVPAAGRIVTRESGRVTFSSPACEQCLTQVPVGV